MLEQILLVQHPNEVCFEMILQLQLFPLAEAQKREAIADTEVKIEKAKNQFAIEKLEAEAQIKRQLMELEFNYNMQLGEQKVQREAAREKEIEERIIKLEEKN